MQAEPSPLARFVADAWARHGTEAQSLVDGLRERAATLPADADGAAALVLAEHLWLAHLHHAPGLRAFVAALPASLAATAPTDAALQRTQWVLAAADGGAPGPLPDAPRWRALQNLWSLWCAQGRVAEARAMLEVELPAALTHADPVARKALAATGWTLAQDLREAPRGDGPRDAFMIELALASRALWATAGTWVNVERGDWLLARCHALLGQGGPALAHARACLSLVQQHVGEPGADDFEFFFAHEALAWAQRAAGDASGEAAEVAQMQARLAAITDDGLRPMCADALAALRK